MRATGRRRPRASDRTSLTAKKGNARRSCEDQRAVIHDRLLFRTDSSDRRVFLTSNEVSAHAALGLARDERIGKRPGDENERPGRFPQPDPMRTLTKRRGRCLGALLDGSAIEANPGYFVGEPRGPRLMEMRIATREGVRSAGGHSARLSR
jgi:hypothetical protein